MISSEISRDMASALSALREDYQPKRVTFADLALEGNRPDLLSPKQSLSSFISAKPFFPRDHVPDAPPPEAGQLAELRSQLGEERRGREAALQQLEALQAECLALQEDNKAAEREVETGRVEREELRRALEESEKRLAAVLERAVSSEKSILSFVRDKAAGSLSAELLELDRLVKWTELNPNTSVHAQQLRTHLESVRELRQRVTEQYAAQLDLLERGTPLARIPRVCSEVPPRPLPVPDPVPYIPTDVECSLPSAGAEPAVTGFAAPRYGPMVVSQQEDVQARLIRKLSNWHPELTDSQLFGHIIAAQQAAPGQSFSGMSVTDIITCVHQLIISSRNN